MISEVQLAVIDKPQMFHESTARYTEVTAIYVVPPLKMIDRKTMKLWHRKTLKLATKSFSPLFMIPYF